MGGVLAALMHALPVCELAARHDVARIRKRRDPAAVLEPGIPADMVPMQMRAHHVVDIFDCDPGSAEIGDIRRAQPMKLRPARALLVVAEAGINEDSVPPGLDDEAVKAEEKVAGRLID